MTYGFLVMVSREFLRSAFSFCTDGVCHINTGSAEAALDAVSNPTILIELLMQYGCNVVTLCYTARDKHGNFGHYSQRWTLAELKQVQDDDPVARLEAQQVRRRLNQAL